MRGVDLICVAAEDHPGLALELGVLSREVAQDRVRLHARDVGRLAGKRAPLELQHGARRDSCSTRDRPR